MCNICILKTRKSYFKTNVKGTSLYSFVRTWQYLLGFLLQLHNHPFHPLRVPCLSPNLLDNEDGMTTLYQCIKCSK